MKQAISLVLSSGGARGIAHIGVIEELEREGFEIKSIAGTSMGALVGGIYTTGKLKEFKEWIYTLNRIDVFKLIDFTFSSQGLIKGDRVFTKMRTFIPEKNIEEMKIFFAAIATDIINEKEVVFTSGSSYDAIRASIAIPTVFTPVKYNNTLLVDGGVLNPIPINHVKRTKGDILIVANVNAHIPIDESVKPLKKQKKEQKIYMEKIQEFRKKIDGLISDKNKLNLGYFNLMTSTTSAMLHQISSMILEKYNPDILINISKDACSVFDFYKAKQLVENGRISTVKSIERFKAAKNT